MKELDDPYSLDKQIEYINSLVLNIKENDRNILDANYIDVNIHTHILQSLKELKNKYNG